MAVSNGQTGDENTFNNAFGSKSRANVFTGVQGLNHSGSGAEVVNIQQLLNYLMQSLGFSSEDDANKDTYDVDPTKLYAVANGQNRKVAIKALDAALKAIDTRTGQLEQNIPTSKYDAIIDPAPTNDVGEGYIVGSHWFNTIEGSLWICLDNTDDAAIWVEAGGAGGAGGGGSFSWELIGDYSPIDSIYKVNSSPPVRVFEFGSEFAGGTEIQTIYAYISVPMNYEIGNQIKLKGGTFICQNNTDAVAWRAKTYLAQHGVTLPENSPHHSNTNEVDLSSKVSLGELSPIGDIDLTDVSGKINDIAVSPGNQLIVCLYRRNDDLTGTNAAEVAKFLKYSTYVSFGE